MGLDFYTVKTSGDIENNMESIIKQIMLYAQPSIVGEPYTEKGKQIFRFAIRPMSIRPFEEDFKLAIEQIIGSEVSVTRATRL